MAEGKVAFENKCATFVVELIPQVYGKESNPFTHKTYFSVLIHVSCFAKSQLLPKDDPVTCLNTKAAARVFAIECCKGYDFCNLDLHPTLGIRSPLFQLSVNL